MGEDGPLVVVGVGDSREAVAVEVVGGLGDGGGAGGHGLGVDGVAVRDVEVDEAAGGRILGRQGVGEHEGGTVDLDLGVADAAPGHGHSDACVQVGLVSASSSSCLCESAGANVPGCRSAI